MRWTPALTGNAGEKPLALALKSGNFGPRLLPQGLEHACIMNTQFLHKSTR